MEADGVSMVCCAWTWTAPSGHQSARQLPRALRSCRKQRAASNGPGGRKDHHRRPAAASLLHRMFFQGRAWR